MDADERDVRIRVHDDIGRLLDDYRLSETTDVGREYRPAAHADEPFLATPPCLTSLAVLLALIGWTQAGLAAGRNELRPGNPEQSRRFSPPDP